MIPDRDSIVFNVLRNALYQTARRRTFERWNRIFNFLVVALGAAAVGDVLTKLGIQQGWMGMAVAVIGALQLVLDFGRQARDHQMLQRDYYNLLADIEMSTRNDDEARAEWNGRMIKIGADEPPTLRAIDAKAYNDAIDATGLYAQTERLHVPFLHRLLGGFVPFEGRQYLKYIEIAASYGRKLVTLDQAAV